MHPSLPNLNLQNFYQILRYFISGGTALLLDLALLFLFTTIFGLWYLISTVAAFAIAIIVSFLLQKLWTFKDATADRTKKQFIVYIAVAIGNTVLNTFFVYFFVQYLGIFYLLSQIIAAGIIAIESFFIYQHFIFNQKIQESQN